MIVTDQRGLLELRYLPTVFAAQSWGGMVVMMLLLLMGVQQQKKKLKKKEQNNPSARKPVNQIFSLEKSTNYPPYPTHLPSSLLPNARRTPYTPHHLRPSLTAPYLQPELGRTWNPIPTSSTIRHRHHPSNNLIVS